MDTEKPAVLGVIPTIRSPDCDKHIKWMKNVFHAQLADIYHSQDEKVVMHCSMVINSGYVYLCDASLSMADNMPMKDGMKEETESKGIVLHLELEDPDVFWKKALANGGTVVEEMKQQFWGTLYGSVRDPFGFVWGLMKGGDCRKSGVIPYLMMEEGKCEEHVQWLVKAFGGEVKDKHQSDGQQLIQHCSVRINGGFVYLADDIKMVTQKAETVGGSSGIVLHLEMANPKVAWEKLLQNDAKVILDLKVQFWGDLYGVAQDYTQQAWSFSETPPPKPTGKENGVLPYIVSPDCEKHIQWIEKVLSGEVKDRVYTEKTKKIMHCKMSVNGGPLMLCDKIQDSTDPTLDKDREDQKGFLMHMAVSDPDAIWKQALENGGTCIVELKKQFWGDYYGMFQDPFGYRWSVLKA